MQTQDNYNNKLNNNFKIEIASIEDLQKEDEDEPINFFSFDNNSIKFIEEESKIDNDKGKSIILFNFSNI